MGTRAKFPSLDPDELLATVSYLPLGGDADGLGDGIVPWRVGIMVSCCVLLLLLLQLLLHALAAVVIAATTAAVTAAATVSVLC